MKPIVIHLHTVQRSGRTAAIAGCICLLAALTTSRLHADEAPLYEQEPYDTIKLDAENKNVLLKVFPLELPGRKIPAKPKEYEEWKSGLSIGREIHTGSCGAISPK